MQTNVSIADNIYLIGVDDRRTALFENLWPLPAGVSYNSYLIRDERCVLLDTVQFGSEGAYIDRIESALQGRSLDYLVINHMEPDHSGEVESVVRRYPAVRILGNWQTKRILESYFGDVSANFMEVKDGDSLDLGSHSLRFFMTPWIHWPETMMTYETTEKFLFSGDAFGTFGTVDGAATDRQTDLNRYESEMRRYYSNIVGKFGGMVQKGLAKLASLEIRALCPLHGPVWERQASEVISLYDKWSRCEADNDAVIIYASMYNNTAHMADYIAKRMTANGIEGIKVYDVSKTHLSYLISEIWRCRYVVLGSCAYNTGMFPLMELLCNSMLHYGLKNRRLAIFGGCSFGGGGVRELKKFAAGSEWEMICDPVEITGRATPESLEKLLPLADAVASAMKDGKKGETC